jgi:hypothetical protein
MTTTINASASSGLVSTADTSTILALQTNGTTAVTIDASQNVGIGTSSPASKLDVVGSASFSGNLGVGDFAAATSVGLNVRFIGNLTSTDIVGISNSISAPASASNSTIGVYSSLRATAASGSRGFLSAFYAEAPSMGATSTASTMRGLYVNNQGNAAINNAYGVYIEAQSGSPTTNQGLRNLGTSRLDGNVGLNTTPTTSGTGITFPATQSASSDANTLDDYEEGTWTATWTSATPPTTPPTATGTYTKIGRVVTVSVFFENGNTTGGSGLMFITGLPFPVGGTLGSRGSGAVNFYGISFAGSYCVAEASASEIYFRTITSNAAWSDMSMTAGSTKYVSTTITYIV